MSLAQVVHICSINDVCMNFSPHKKIEVRAIPTLSLQKNKPRFKEVKGIVLRHGTNQVAEDQCDRLLGNRKMNKTQPCLQPTWNLIREVKTGQSLIPHEEAMREVLIKSIQVE